MNEVVWRFELPMAFGKVFEIELPDSNCFLKADMRPCGPCAWYQVDPDRPKQKQKLVIYETGHTIGTGIEGHYIGHLETFFDGDFVWHLYELEKIGGEKE